MTEHKKQNDEKGTAVWSPLTTNEKYGRSAAEKSQYSASCNNKNFLPHKCSYTMSKPKTPGYHAVAAALLLSRAHIRSMPSLSAACNMNFRVFSSGTKSKAT